MYIEVSPQRPKESARLVSPVISVSSAITKCLTFWYHMYGPHVGSLNVYANTTTLGSPIWSKSGTQGNQWKQAIDLEIQMNQSYSLVFEGVRGRSYRGDIAIDDIKLKDGSCSAPSGNKICVWPIVLTVHCGAFVKYNRWLIHVLL